MQAKETKKKHDQVKVKKGNQGREGKKEEKKQIGRHKTELKFQGYKRTKETHNHNHTPYLKDQAIYTSNTYKTRH